MGSSHRAVAVKKAEFMTGLVGLLVMLAFEKSGNKYRKKVGGATLTVDLDRELFIYPEGAGLKIWDRTTCNFAQHENIIVFECVHRLLEKGYRPESIELEPKWRVGHGGSGGKADILVKDVEDHPLIIIECKNPGGAFSKAWNDTLATGGQLFSYAQQIAAVQFLCLYTSEHDRDGVTYTSNVIAHKDNADYLRLNPDLKSFAAATDVGERHRCWTDTYGSAFTPVGLFESGIPAYQVGKDKYELADLHPISADEHKSLLFTFFSVLRQHNISARENAFDKLINILLCKLVDELDNPDDLQFVWKGIAYETHFDLLDRLQSLYQQGMSAFLGEEITYINQDDLMNAMRFIADSPDTTRDAVWQLFVRQKFFTNNDFSLIDVHNERLFLQNAEVLLKLVQMWQGIRLTSSSSQFLGDLFEQFLDQGVKQSEGQFFTPVPLCRFMINSLPLHSALTGRSRTRAIDYACGAGHFLTELADAFERTAMLDGATNKEFAITGIEKEYRLSKVAKVAAFMHGHRDIDIKYLDALDATVKDDQLKAASFDVLVANPPYSVKGFLETLPDRAKQRYAVWPAVSEPEKFGAIETFFLERAAQLLAPGGVAAIILPSGLLHNEGVHARAREVLLRSFEILGIVELGNRTFGKTGTTTVTLFLRRRANQPEDASHFAARVQSWWDCTSADELDARLDGAYNDRWLIETYLEELHLDWEPYRALLLGGITDDLLQHRIFSHYESEFTASSELARVRGTAKFKKLSVDEADAEVARLRWESFRSREMRRLEFFCLARSQRSDVLVVRSPTATEEQKQFLGYAWSSGRETGGIHLTKDDAGNHVTPLYDPLDQDNPDKLARYVRAAFDGELQGLPTSLRQYGFTCPLHRLVPFNRVVDSLPIELVDRAVDVADRYRVPAVPLADVSQVQKGTSITEANAVAGDVPVVAGGRTNSYTHNVSNRPGNIITVSASGAGAGFVNFWGEPIFASDCSTVAGAEDAETRFLYYVLKDRQGELYKIARGSGQPHVYPAQLNAFIVPWPGRPVLEEVVQRCDATMSELRALEENDAALSKKLLSMVDAVHSSSTARVAIRKLVTGGAQYGLSRAMTPGHALPDGVPIFRMHELHEGLAVDNGHMKRVRLEDGDLARYQLEPGDILFNRTNSLEHVGKTGVFNLQGTYVFASYLLRLAPDDAEVNAKFLALMMGSSPFRKVVRDVAIPSINQANVSATKLLDLEVPSLPRADQDSVVAEAASTQGELVAVRLRIGELEFAQREALRDLLEVPPQDATRADGVGDPAEIL